MQPFSTQLEAESREAPEVVRRQQTLARPLAALVDRLTDKPPRLVVTCARGSSAHAATYGKHLFERHLAIPVSAAAPNIASIYRATLDLRDQLFLAISQSGRSADLVATAEMARTAGALTVALVNEADSPLARACEIELPLQAGPEHSVAASKSFVASLALLTRLTAAWSRDGAMQRSLDALPERLAAATELDWSAAVAALARAHSVMTIGRGPTLGIAREAALKLKEACNVHAEPFSSAEFRHGPIAMVEPTYPVLIFTPADQAAEGMDALAADLTRKGAAVFATGSPALPALRPDQPDADAICLIQSFYQLLLRVAARRGSDVDRPRHLQKVTRTR